MRAAQAAAEAATLVKGQFLANMSHEIRNPLTAVLGFTDLLRKSSALVESDRTYVERIAGAGSALLAIVNDVLDFSKLESGMVTIVPKPTAVVALAQDSLTLFEGQASAKGLHLRFEADEALPAMMLVDGDRLRQILINLTANAVKFTERGAVTLSVRRAGETGLRFEVSDTGPGLAEADCARLFQRFTQIDGSNTRRHRGTGLGLAICKGLAEAMDGEIGVDSVVGRGSTFHVTLPVTAVDAEPTTDSSAGHTLLTGVRVLVVDDNAANRELATRLLEPLGADVRSAEGGQAALDHLGVHPVDVVLLDLRMPDLGGPEVLSRLRAGVGPNQFTPVLAFSAEPRSVTASGPDGFDGVVAKPIDIAALAGALAAAVERRDSLASRSSGSATVD
ncbi:ATP-binding protein [uncultured Phenylobacterium sp.]|uniref:ATP-binding response regulator n=1 Tax=uncultured Phenylobacterium sp. TaxID=349273 RepID=UPI0025EC0CFC|nr:ATP-binding protein [uncultured Phenylobacterium sp.]